MRFLKVSGVAKKTLYHHFKSKNELIIATLIKRDEAFCKWLECRLRVGKCDLEVLNELFYALDDWFAGNVDDMQDFYGCYFINSSAALARQSEEIKDPL